MGADPQHGEVLLVARKATVRGAGACLNWWFQCWGISGLEALLNPQCPLWGPFPSSEQGLSQGNLLRFRSL